MLTTTTTTTNLSYPIMEMTYTADMKDYNKFQSQNGQHEVKIISCITGTRMGVRN